MATSVNVSPSLGHAAIFTQGGVGTTPGYDAIDVRRGFGYEAIQEGVIDSGSYKVTTTGNTFLAAPLTIAASTGNGAYVQGDAVTSQGLYYVPPHSAAISSGLDIVAADATNPRIDQVVLELKDDTHDAGGLNVARVRVVAGTPTSGATLDNRNGAAATVSSSIRLADILVPATATTILAGNIRDRRPWARGALNRILRSTGTSPTTTSTTMAAIDATNISPRIECSGAPIKLTLRGVFTHTAGGQPAINVGFAIDGTLVDGITDAGAGWGRLLPSAAATLQDEFCWETVPSAGSHVIAPWWDVVTAGTLTLATTATTPALFMVEELVRQNASND